MLSFVRVAVVMLSVAVILNVDIVMLSVILKFFVIKVNTVLVRNFSA